MPSHLPPEVVELIVAATIQSRCPAWLAIDPDGRLAEWGGDLAAYGLTGLVRNEPAVGQVVFLEGLLPPVETPTLLPTVQTAPGVVADLYIARGAERDWVLLLDAGDRYARRQKRQQAANEGSLRRERGAPSAAAPADDPESPPAR